ncbi:MAG: pilus assembly protein TadG-related protein [Acidimicrobiia bacterium]
MNERGAAMLWVLGLSVIVLFLGGISLDLWRAFEVRQDLAALADSAAAAGASQIDVDVFRSSGEVVLDVRAAEAAALASIAAQQDASRVTVAPDITFNDPGLPTRISVTLEGELRFTLLNILPLDEDSIPVRATGTAGAFAVP